MGSLRLFCSVRTHFTDEDLRPREAKWLSVLPSITQVIINVKVNSGGSESDAHKGTDAQEMLSISHFFFHSSLLPMALGCLREFNGDGTDGPKGGPAFLQISQNLLEPVLWASFSCSITFV